MRLKLDFIAEVGLEEGLICETKNTCAKLAEIGEGLYARGAYSWDTMVCA